MIADVPLAGLSLFKWAAPDSYNTYNTIGFATLFVHILPYIDAQAVYDKLNMNEPMS
jgi:hypothetical protein